MAVETAEDRAAMLSGDDFGVAASWIPQGGAAVAIEGIFDRAYESLDVEAGVPVQSSAPMFWGRSADLNDAAPGDTLIVAGEYFQVVEVKPDGTGLTELRLAAWVNG